MLVALFGGMVGCHLHGTASSVAHELNSQLAAALKSSCHHLLLNDALIENPAPNSGFESYLGSAVVKSPGATLPLNVGLTYV